MSFVETMQQLEAIARGTDKDVATKPAAVAARLDAMDLANGNVFTTVAQATVIEDELKAIGQMTGIDPLIRAAALRAEQRIEGQVLEKKAEGLLPDTNVKPQIAAPAQDQDDDAPQPVQAKKQRLLPIEVAAVALAARKKQDFNEGTVNRLIETATRSLDMDVQRSAMSSLEAASAAGFDFTPKQLVALSALAFEKEIPGRSPDVVQKAKDLVSAKPGPGVYGEDPSRHTLTPAPKILADTKN